MFISSVLFCNLLCQAHCLLFYLYYIANPVVSPGKKESFFNFFLMANPLIYREL